MTKKVMAAQEALIGGASEVIVADANLNDPVTTALDGGGTHVTPGAVGESSDSDGKSTGADEPSDPGGESS
jgi:acetylglutamate/LysW-gamma-L-alpha-aminoadipate kinase